MIAAAVGPFFTFLDSVVKRAFPDKTEAARIQSALEQATLAADLAVLQGQLAINAEEAKSEHIFVSGWRPFVGWTCGASLAWSAVVCPMVSWGLQVFGVSVPPLPTLPSELTIPILGSLLGLGTLRTYEKATASNKRR